MPVNSRSFRPFSHSSQATIWPLRAQYSYSVTTDLPLLEEPLLVDVLTSWEQLERVQSLHYRVTIIAQMPDDILFYIG